MTNTLKVRCDSCGENYWYKDGILCPKCGSNQRIIIATNDEGMQVCEKNIVILVMVFDLYDSVKIGGNISNSKNIEFVIDSECPGSIKQFLIKIVNPTPLDEKKALEQASAITNYLRLKGKSNCKTQVTNHTKNYKWKNDKYNKFHNGCYITQGF